MSALLGESGGQGWLQLAELGLAFLLSALIGLEREVRQKSAGLRTYTVVGFACALIMLVSKYGFTDVLQNGRVVLDPSRVAAQIVSGVGFIGGGVIFVRKDLVRGLTTAATFWLTAAVGMACGAGLPILAVATTAGHFLIIGLFPILERQLPKSRWAAISIRVSYWDGRGVLREALAACTDQGFAIRRLQIEGDARDRAGRQGWKGRGRKAEDEAPAVEAALQAAPPGKGIVTLALEITGKKSLSTLVTLLSGIEGVVKVQAGDAGPSPE